MYSLLPTSGCLRGDSSADLQAQAGCGKLSQLQHSSCRASTWILLQDLAWARNGANRSSHVCGRPWSDPQVHLAILPQVWQAEGKKVQLHFYF